MALFGNIDESYTNTGKGTLGRWSSTLSFLPPFLRNLQIPFVGTAISLVVGYADTLIEAGQWLFRGKIGSAATVLAAGAVATTVNSASSNILWGANLLSGATTGASLGTHARAATETLIGMGTGALGVRPQVLSSYPAAIGSIGGGAAPSGPGAQASRISAERNQNADQAYARYMSGDGGVHVNELQSANGRGA